MASQESSGSSGSGSSNLGLSLSQETVDYMWNNVSDIAEQVKFVYILGSRTSGGPKFTWQS